VLSGIEDFARLLRQHGIPVSTPEIADAASALCALGVDDPAHVSSALAATLIKKGGHRALFDRLFALHFGLGRVSSAERQGVDEDSAALLEAMAAELAAMGEVARALLGAAPLDAAALIRASNIQGELSGIVNPFQVGYASQRVIELAQLDPAEQSALDAIEGARERGSLSDDDVEGAASLVRRNAARLREAIREAIRAEVAMRTAEYAERARSEALSETPLTRLRPKDVEHLRSEVRRLAALLRSRFVNKPRREQRGRLDVRRTLRASLATGGVPFDLVMQRRVVARPSLLVLCDVSDSVQGVARFTLELSYMLQDVFSRVRSFAFVAEVGELSQLFRDHDIDRAVARAFAGDAVNVLANSNYGVVLDQFFDRYAGTINKRTTILVIGDGRNNYHQSRASVLGELRRRARALWWITPEPPVLWGFGDSAMREYEKHCDRVAVATNWTGLSEVIVELLDAVHR